MTRDIPPAGHRLIDPSTVRVDDLVLWSRCSKWRRVIEVDETVFRLVAENGRNSSRSDAWHNVVAACRRERSVAIPNPRVRLLCEFIATAERARVAERETFDDRIREELDGWSDWSLTGRIRAGSTFTRDKVFEAIHSLLVNRIHDETP